MDSLEGDLDRYSMREVGDFRVGAEHLGDAREHHAERSRAARRADAGRRAPITTNYRVWENNPNRWDFPGVDTPTGSPALLPKDLKTENYARSPINVRTTDAPEHGTEPRRSPLGSEGIADEHSRAEATARGLGPDVLERHAGYYDERDRHWERGRTDVERQDQVPEAFHGKEGRGRPGPDLGDRGILEARVNEAGGMYGTRR